MGTFAHRATREEILTLLNFEFTISFFLALKHWLTDGNHAPDGMVRGSPQQSSLSHKKPSLLKSLSTMFRSVIFKASDTKWADIEKSNGPFKLKGHPSVIK